jgi:hypothetical protein
MKTMTQVGRGSGSKFIDKESESSYENMAAFCAYKASTFNYHNQMAIVLDTLNRFV